VAWRHDQLIMEPLRKEFNEIKEKINQLKESLDLKDEQIRTLKESLTFKKEQVQTLKNNSNYQKSQIQKLEELIETREEQLKSMEEPSDEDKELKKSIEEKNEKVEQLEAQVEELEETLKVKERKIAELTEGAEILDSKVIDYTDFEVSKAEILEKMEEILKKAINSIIICVPRITDLERLSIFDIKSSVAIKICTLINLKRTDHADLFKEFSDSGTISVRNYEREDRYIIMRDSEELLFALIGKREKNHLAFYTTDANHLNELNPIVMDTWLRSRKIR